MTLEVLLSAMYLKDFHYIESLNITGSCVVINQCGGCREEEILQGNRRIKYIETTQRGLSRSRNMAIRNALADICVLCDNDVEYVPGYEEMILHAYETHSDSDMIIFHVPMEDQPEPCYGSERNLGFLTSLKVRSVEISFRRESVRGICFNEHIGSGTRFGQGEENAFIYECLRRGKKVTYIPLTIAHLRQEPSVWKGDFDRGFFLSRGASYEAMTACWSWFLILQYAVRKHRYYAKFTSFRKALRYMFAGRMEYRKEREEYRKGQKGKQEEAQRESRKGKQTETRLFIAGDYRSATGPSHVLRSLIDYYAHPFRIQKQVHGLMRIPEIWRNTVWADVVLYSGFSRQNRVGMLAARLFGRPSFYLMHGCIWYENQVSRRANFRENSRWERLEEDFLKNFDYIVAVSPFFQSWLMEHYPGYREKILCLTNGIDWTELEKKRNTLSFSGTSKDCFSVLSLGGGVKQKNILALCHAIERIYEENSDCNIRLTVAGSHGEDSEKIRSFSFVRDLGICEHSTVLSLMSQASLYVQCSIFETFGLAAVEALACGCSILVSENAGIWSVFGAVSEEDQIASPCDPEEIKRKLLHLMKSPNQERLLSALDKKATSCEARAEELYKMAGAVQEDRRRIH